MYLAVVLVSLLVCAESAIVRVCYGNFVLVGAQCVPCKWGYLKVNGQCVKLEDYGWGSNTNENLLPAP